MPVEDGSPFAGDPLVRPEPPRSWRERAEQVADATGTTPARLAAGGALLLVVVLGALWLTRPPDAPPEVALPFASTTASSSTTSTTTAPAEVVVHVTGAVLFPGVHRLEEGARVVDAVEAAGGLASTADGSRLNLAAPVVDGARVFVPVVGEAEPVVAGPTGPLGPASTDGGGVPTATAPLDLNRADAAALDALPGVGPATAAAILEHRERIGGFTSVDQLLDVPGIGEAKLAQLRELVTV